ncbi:Zinc finger protein [Musa troglodytarum]|uniref:Zinc finger protein n=1 Tax=Musa troglodytarum TaxID=320322 RepID=A0A9E7HBM9_9LILI|nr:Zinc finger protein [Musa troglodytarum]
MRQRVPEGSKLAAPPPRSQPPMEAEAENQQGAEEEGVRVPGEELRAPPPVEGARRPHRHQEALLPQARREEMEVRQVLQALRGAVRLQSPLQDLRHQGVPLRLWNRFLEEGQLHNPQGLLRCLGGRVSESRSVKHEQINFHPQ